LDLEPPRTFKDRAPNCEGFGEPGQRKMAFTDQRLGIQGSCRKRKSQIEHSLEEWIAQAFTEFPPREAPLTTEVILAMSKLHLPHRNPADAFLAATARVFQLTLVTTDARLRTAKGISFL
jgi:predicted nucleic acid-binding protein